MTRRWLGLVLQFLGVVLLAALATGRRPPMAEGPAGFWGFLLFIAIVFLIGTRLYRGKRIPISRRSD